MFTYSSRHNFSSLTIQATTFKQILTIGGSFFLKDEIYVKDQLLLKTKYAREDSNKFYQLISIVNNKTKRYVFKQE